MSPVDARRDPLLGRHVLAYHFSTLVNSTLPYCCEALVENWKPLDNRHISANKCIVLKFLALGE